METVVLERNLDQLFHWMYGRYQETDATCRWLCDCIRYVRNCDLDLEPQL